MSGVAVRGAGGSLARYCAATGAGALSYSSYTDPASALQPIWAVVREALKLPGAATAATAAAGSSALEMQTAALTASIQAMNQLIAAQQRGGIRLGSALMWLAAPVAIGCAVHYLGWARIGWVTGEQLQEGLVSVRTAVGAMVDSLGEALHARFVRVDELLAETAQSVQQASASRPRAPNSLLGCPSPHPLHRTSPLVVPLPLAPHSSPSPPRAHHRQVSETTAELKAEVHAVGESLQALEQRMAPIETNCATAAQGVGVLCELIKTSGLLSNASGSSLRKLDHFTGSTDSAEPSARANHLLPPPSQPAPMLPSPLERAAPNFVRAMMEPPVMRS